MHWTSQPDPTTGELFAVAHNITELKSATNELFQSRQQYKEFFDFAHAMICSHDEKGRIQTINAQGAEWLGYSVESMIGTKITEYMIPEHAEGFDEYLDKILSEGSASGIMGLRSKSGEQTYWAFNNILKESGDTAKIFGYALEITNRIQLEQELKLALSENRFPCWFTSDPAGLI